MPCIAQSAILVCQRNMLFELVTNTLFLFHPPFSECPFFIFVDCTQEGSSEVTVGKMNPAVHPTLYLPEYGRRPSTKPEYIRAYSLFNHIKSCSELMVSNLLWVWYDSLSKALQVGALCFVVLGSVTYKMQNECFQIHQLYSRYCWENCTVQVTRTVISMFFFSFCFCSLQMSSVRWSQQCWRRENRIGRQELFQSRTLHLSNGTWRLNKLH